MTEQAQDQAAPATEKKPRKGRSDKGVKRGPRKPKEPVAVPS